MENPPATPLPSKSSTGKFDAVGKVRGDRRTTLAIRPRRGRGAEAVSRPSFDLARRPPRDEILINDRRSHPPRSARRRRREAPCQVRKIGRRAVVSLRNHSTATPRTAKPSLPPPANFPTVPTAPKTGTDEPTSQDLTTTGQSAANTTRSDYSPRKRHWEPNIRNIGNLGCLLANRSLECRKSGHTESPVAFSNLPNGKRGLRTASIIERNSIAFRCGEQRSASTLRGSI